MSLLQSTPSLLSVASTRYLRDWRALADDWIFLRQVQQPHTRMGRIAAARNLREGSRWTTPQNVRSAASANTQPKVRPWQQPNTRPPPPMRRWNSGPTAATGATAGISQKNRKKRKELSSRSGGDSGAATK